MRTYRHRPFLAASAVLLSLVAAWTGSVVHWLITHHDFESVVKAFLLLILLSVIGAYSVLVWRIRTVIDDEAITQYWITNTYRLPFDEITGVEEKYHSIRWYLRIECGERTYEVIPCHSVWPSPVAGGPPRPRAMRAVLADLTSSM